MERFFHRSPHASNFGVTWALACSADSRAPSPASETPAVTQRSASRQALPLTPGRFKCENRSLLSPLLRGDKLRGARAAV